MGEFDEYSNAKKDELASQTLTNYFNAYERLRGLIGGKRNVANIPQKELIEIIECSEFHKPTILNIAVVFKQFKNKPISKLLVYRDTLVSTAKAEQPKKNSQQIIHANTTYDQLINALRDANGTDYLLFYILINYGVRNADLIITPLPSKDKKTKLNKTDNFIILSRNTAKYVRQDYKTVAKYGTQEHIIENQKFIKILKNVIADGNKNIFVNTMGNSIPANDFSKYIKSRFNKYIPNSNLTQSTIYKIILQHYEQLGDLKAMREFANTRGHTPATQETEYSTIDYNE